MQDSLPIQCLKLLDRCKEAFSSKCEAKIEKEIQDFYLHHDDVLSYGARVKEYEESKAARKQLVRARAAFVAEEMARYDRELSIAAEAREWGWSPLFSHMILLPLPPCLCRPCEHSEEEFQGLIKWMERENGLLEEKNDPPHMARALKLFSRSETGSRIPMLCPVLGLTEERLMKGSVQVMLAMEELIRVGKIYFPTMDIQGDSFEVFREVLDVGDDLGGQVESYQQWRRSTFIRACMDVLDQGKEEILRDMWVTKAGVDQEKVADRFRQLLLLRENIDLEYAWGSLEATGQWPAAGETLYDAAKEMLVDSMRHMNAKLSDWNIMVDCDDIDYFRPSQVISTFDLPTIEPGVETDSIFSRMERSQSRERNAGLEWDNAPDVGQVEDVEPSVPGQEEDGQPSVPCRSPVVSLADP